MGCLSCYTCDELEEQVLNVGALPADPSNDTEINNLLTAGDAVLYKNLKVLVNAPSEISQTSLVAGESDRVSNYDRTASLIDGNVNAGNVDAYNAMNSSNGKVFGGALLYYCESEQVKFIEANTIMAGGFNDVENEQSKWEGELRWRSKSDPTLHTAPSGIFGQ